MNCPFAALYGCAKCSGYRAYGGHQAQDELHYGNGAAHRVLHNLEGVRIAYVFDTRVALLIAGLLAVGLNVIAVRRSGLLSLD